MRNNIQLAGILTAHQVRATGEHIASQQLPNGLLPWFTGHHADPWDHIESAMALTASGFDDAALRAFEWSAEHQRADGSWPMEIVGGQVRDASADSNQCAYIAVGVWHRWLVTGDRRFVDAMWPTVRAAVDFSVELQTPMGGIAWARDQFGTAHQAALLTGSSCVVLSLRCALALADLVEDPRPDWELSLSRLVHAVACHPESFEDKSRYSMDWYYPVLGGALRGARARSHLEQRWSDFVIDGRGIRCVDDAPWVTAAETCELSLALSAIGEDAKAMKLLADIQFLRASDGGYWTGWVWPEDAVWPEERTTWTGAAVILAADALARCTPAHGLFAGERLPRVAQVRIDNCDETCWTLTGRA